MPNVQIQVLPFDAGGHAGAGGAFSILRFPYRELSDVVFLEHLTSGIYLDRPQGRRPVRGGDRPAVHRGRPAEWHRRDPQASPRRPRLVSPQAPVPSRPADRASMRSSSSTARSPNSVDTAMRFIDGKERLGEPQTKTSTALLNTSSGIAPLWHPRNHPWRPHAGHRD